MTGQKLSVILTMDLSMKKTVSYFIEKLKQFTKLGWIRKGK